MILRRLLAATAACSVLCACSTTPKVYSATDSASPADGAFSFVVIGDTPYSPDDETMLASAVPLIKAGDYPFIIHVGDFKGGKAPCATEHDDRFATLISELAPTPVVYTPGDNDWTDCDRNTDEATGKPYSDLSRLEVIRDRFFSAEPKTPKAFEFERQSAQVENATWKHDGVRALTLHVVGTANGRNWVTGDPLDAAAAAADAKDAANLDWLRHGVDLAMNEKARALVIAMQGDLTDISPNSRGMPCIGASEHDEPCDAFVALRAAIRAAAMEFGAPVLVIHGDTAPFTLNQDFAGDGAPRLWRLNAAGDAGAGITGEFYGTRDVTLVNVNASSPTPFAARGFLTGKPARN